MTAASTQPNGSETGPGSGSETSHNPLLKLTHAVKSVSLGRAHASSNGHATAREQLPEGQGRAAQKSAEKRKEKDAIAERIESEKAALEERYAAEDQRAAKEEPAEVRQKYAEGDLHPGEIVELGAVATMMAGQEVTFRARIETQRRVSAGLDFLLFREQVHTIQGVLTQTTPHMVKWVQRLPTESIVEVVGTLQKPKDPIRSASIHHLELAVDSIHLVSPAHDLPWDLYRPPESLRLRTQARILDLRHPSNQAIFRIRAKMVATFRRVLEDRGFLEINTPKFQPAATESGAEVFKVDYFGRTAFLAQSPQLPKQMCISADFGKVYEVGPVFRAENSNTHRHLAEYTGLDIETVLPGDYHELILLLCEVMKAIFAAVVSMPELQIVRNRFPSDDLKWLEETPVIPFPDGIQMLRDDGRDVEMEDLSTRDEIRLGELVKEKYDTDFYVLDRFPASARPFYTMRDETDPEFTKSFDMFVRGQEICTGGQRIHLAEDLRKSMRAAGIAENGMEQYLSAIDFGAPPHGGAGLGLERLVMLILNLGDVRNATLFHRDPKSLPEKPPALPHPEADTTRHHDRDEVVPLEKLIANYGDASNTSWLDDRFELWRHNTGGVVGYVRQNKFAMITGDPLCDERQYHQVIQDFVTFVETELKLTPVWMLVSDEVQQILGRKLGWRTLTCTEEQRVDGGTHHEASGHDERRAEKEGVQVREITPDQDFIERAERSIEEWKAQRNDRGKQVHLTEVRPWVDQEHRRYFVAEKDQDGDRHIYALVVLAQLAPRHGWQVKWALDFPGSPSGIIEVVVSRALGAVSGPVTFGAGVSGKLKPGEHLGGVRAKFLARTYTAVATSLRLGKKSGFREKFGAKGEEVYICYPRHGVSVRDLDEIVKFFED